MILIIAVLAIALFITCVGLYALNHDLKSSRKAAEKYQKRWLDELDVSSDLRNEKFAEWERANIAEEQITVLKQSFKDLVEEQNEELNFGVHVKWRSTQKPTSQTYKIHFDIEPNGQRILEELTSRFKRNVFTNDERETCRRIGRAEVVDFILNRINTANDSRYSEQLELMEQENHV
jgi:hypothetical protein